ncbi:unnamed protein product [marine sediment metagenome]|uniref:GYD domain-containing protein n=1 Tax=marine sediment metagenome TaxID=412755 RepID=X0REZ7_9ZZZZ
MPTYITLIKWTDQGIRNVKESPQRLDATKKSIEAAGGKFIGYYLTMGRYDAVLIAEALSDEVVAAQILGAGSQGNVRTETMKAFPEDQYRNIIAKVQ